MKSKFLSLTLTLTITFAPSFAFAAYNDVSLTTDAIISLGGYTLNVSGSTVAVQSIVVNSSSFSVTLASGSSFKVSSPTLNQLNSDISSDVSSNTCTGSESSITLAYSSGGTVTNVITPSATICTNPVSSGGGGGGGGGFSSPSPITPNGGFTATRDITNSQNKTVLHFGFGNDITNIAISENINFTPATYINATSSVEWTATTTKILYIKYCNRYGRCSNPISLQINAYVPAPIVSNVYIFYKNLSYRMTNSDVLELQKYLNTRGFVIAQNGVGSVGKETNYFGLLTKNAVIKFQEAHTSDILTPNKLTKGTGYFGPSTRAFVNR